VLKSEINSAGELIITIESTQENGGLPALWQGHPENAWLR